MIEILKQFIELVSSAINQLFFLKIDLTDTIDIYLGVLVIAFLFIMLSIYFIFRALGIIGGDD